VEFEKIIGGKFKRSTLPYIALKIHDVKLLVAGVRPWTSHYNFFGFNGVQPWARHFH
jgi:hypothetical protein